MATIKCRRAGLLQSSAKSLVLFGCLTLCLALAYVVLTTDWAPRSIHAVATLTADPGDAILTVAFSSDGTLLASAGLDKRIRIWHVPSRELRKTLTVDSTSLCAVCFTSQDHQLMAGGAGGTIWFVDLNRGQEQSMLQAHDSAILGMAFSKSQRYIATASDDCTVRVWDVGKRVAVAKLVGHNDLVECAAFHPLNEQLLASGSLDQTIRVWNRATLKEIATLRGHKGRIFSLAFSSDGQSLVSGSADGTAKVWETTGWKERTTLSVGHWVTSCAFGQHSQKVVLGLGTGLVEFWDISTGSRVLTLIGHQFAVNSLAFSPDGMTLASGSHDETVKLWQIPLE